MLLLKLLTPILRQLSFTHSFRDTVEPGGSSVLGWTVVDWTGLDHHYFVRFAVAAA